MSKIREVFLCTEHTSSKEVLIFTNSWTSMTSLFLEAFWRFPWTLLLCCCMFWCYGMDSWWCFSFSFVKCNIKFYATVLFFVMLRVTEPNPFGISSLLFFLCSFNQIDSLIFCIKFISGFALFSLQFSKASEFL